MVDEVDIRLSDKERARIARLGQGARGTPGVAPAIVVIDMLVSFVDDRYPLAHSDTAVPAVEAVGALLDVARPQKVPIFYTVSWDDEFAGIRGRWKGTGNDVPEPSLSTPEKHQIVQDLTPQRGDVVLRKGKPSAFWQTGLLDQLIFHRIDTLIVCGLTTSGCVRATVYDAFAHNFNVIVPRTCVADRIEISHRVTLFDINLKYADVLSQDEVVSYLESLGAAADVV